VRASYIPPLIGPNVVADSDGDAAESFSPWP